MATETTKITYVEGAAASTPAAGRVATYSKADGLMYSKDDAGVETLMSAGVSGSVATDAIWDAAGDLAVGTGANTAARLAIGATNGMVLQRVSGAVAWAFPPGHEWDYKQITAPVAITGTTQGAADTVITSNSFTPDGSPVMVHIFAPYAVPDPNVAGRDMSIMVLDSVGSTVLGNFHYVQNQVASQSFYHAPSLWLRYTPSAASRTLTVKAFVSAGNGSVGANTGGAAVIAAFVRITKV